MKNLTTTKAVKKMYKHSISVLLLGLLSTSAIATECYRVGGLQVDLSEGHVNAGTFFLNHGLDTTKLNYAPTEAVCASIESTAQSTMEGQVRAYILENYGQEKVDKHFPNDYCGFEFVAGSNECRFRYRVENTCSNKLSSGEQMGKIRYYRVGNLPAENQFSVNDDGTISYREGCEVYTFSETPGADTPQLCEI